MRKTIAFLTSLAIGGTMLAAPALATTETGAAAYAKHQADCLVLLFTNPAEHQKQCGGPFTPAPPPSSSTGFGCQVSEIAMPDIYGARIEVADIGCCYGSLAPVLAGHFDWTGWGTIEQRALIACR